MGTYDEWLRDPSDLTFKEWCEARTYPTHFKVGAGGMTMLQALTASSRFSTDLTYTGPITMSGELTPLR